MNIVVFPHKTKEISVALSVVVKIAKAAKHTPSEHANRYYNEWGFGLILYPENLLKSGRLII